MEADGVVLLMHISNAQNDDDRMVLEQPGKTELQECSSNAFSDVVEFDSRNSDYICSCCEKSFKSFWGIQRHIRTNHSEESRCTSQLTAKQPLLQSKLLLKQESKHRLLRQELDESCCSVSDVPEIAYNSKVSDSVIRFPYQPKNSTEMLCDLSDVKFSQTSLYHHRKECNPCPRSCQTDQDERPFCLRKRTCLWKNNNDATPVVMNGRAHLCCRCHKAYLSYAELRKHQRIQHSMKGFPCFLCGLSFMSRGRVAVHKLKCHRKCVCSLCQASVRGMMAFAKHIELCNSGILTVENDNSKSNVTGKYQSEVVDQRVTENSQVLNTEVKVRILRKLHNLKSPINKMGKVSSVKGSNFISSVQVSSGSDCFETSMDISKELQSKTKERCSYLEPRDVLEPHPTSRALFVCKHCSMKFLSDLELKKHSHSCYRKLFNCDQCTFTSAKLSERIVHRRKYHRKHKCNQCNASFSGQIAFAKHVRSLHPGVPVYKANEVIWYYCDRCSRYFVTSNSLMLHYKRLHTVTKQKTCLKDCSSTGKRNSNLESAYTCFWCSKEYPSYVELRRHRALEHRLKPFSCSDCHLTFVSQNAQITHRLKFHRKRRCNLCQVNVCGTVAFNEHVQSSHPGMSVAKVNSRQLVCEYCSAIFDHEKRLNDHIQTRHFGFIHMCKVCSKVLKTEETLRIHLRLHNIETYKTCEICGKRYPRLPGLMAHMRSKHPDSVPEKYRISFSCFHCGTNFTRSTTLRRHIETKHEGRRFACDVCGKIFRNSRYVSQHKKTHQFHCVGSNKVAVE